MAFYGFSASNLTNGNGRPGETRGGYNLDYRTSPEFQTGPHAPADPEIHQKLDNLLTMVSDQKKVLDLTKNSFEELKQTVSRLETRVLEMEKENMGPGHHAKEKKLPLELSTAVKSVHEKMAAEEQFIPDEMYKSKANQRCSSSLIHLVTQQYGSTYSQKVVRKAVHRYYESRRRKLLDNQPARLSIVKETKKTAQTKSFRKQLYLHRKKHLSNQKERDRWGQIDFQYMTEESDLDDDTVAQHKLPWRSEKLNRFIKKLDRKVFESHKAGGFKSKMRVEAAPSVLVPPPNAPKWAISSSCLQATTLTSIISTGQGMAAAITTPTGSTTPTVMTTPMASTTPTVMATPTGSSEPTVMTTHLIPTPPSAVNITRVVTTPRVTSTSSVATTSGLPPVNGAASTNDCTPISSRAGSKRRLNMNTSGSCASLLLNSQELSDSLSDSDDLTSESD